MKRLLKWCLWLVVGWIGITVLAVLALRWIDPPTTAFMLAADVSEVDYEWVDGDRISSNLKLAVIAAEDQRFFDHSGFDFKAINKALEERSRRVRGASTITQQVAKNLFLWSGQSYVRKGIEAYFTVLIELLWPKPRLMEVYVNVAEFGRGTYGAEAAARRYFRKGAKSLTSAEAALMAAVLPNPIRLRIDKPSRYVRQRQRWIQNQMRALGGPAYIKERELAVSRQ